MTNYLVAFLITFCRWHELISLVRKPEVTKIDLQPVFLKWLFMARMSTRLSGSKSIYDKLGIASRATRA